MTVQTNSQGLPEQGQPIPEGWRAPSAPSVLRDGARVRLNPNLQLENVYGPDALFTVRVPTGAECGTVVRCDLDGRAFSFWWEDVLVEDGEDVKVDVGHHPCLSEDWLLDNLPTGWSYDCHLGHPWGFTITATDGRTLFLPLRLLKDVAS